MDQSSGLISPSPSRSIFQRTDGTHQTHPIAPAESDASWSWLNSEMLWTGVATRDFNVPPDINDDGASLLSDIVSEVQSEPPLTTDNDPFWMCGTDNTNDPFDAFDWHQNRQRQGGIIDIVTTPEEAYPAQGQKHKRRRRASPDQQRGDGCVQGMHFRWTGTQRRSPYRRNLPQSFRRISRNSRVEQEDWAVPMKARMAGI